MPTTASDIIATNRNLSTTYATLADSAAYEAKEHADRIIRGIEDIASGEFAFSPSDYPDLDGIDAPADFADGYSPPTLGMDAPTPADAGASRPGNRGAHAAGSAEPLGAFPAVAAVVERAGSRRGASGDRADRAAGRADALDADRARADRRPAGGARHHHARLLGRVQFGRARGGRCARDHEGGVRRPLPGDGADGRGTGSTGRSPR
jgi:hypothetical protein